MPSRPRPSRDPLRLEAESLRRRLARREKERERDRARVEQLIEELNVYREETRQQTEQLIAAQHAIEESRDRYANLYDFAPIGYLTLDHFGSIEEINLVAAQMLGIDRTHGRRSPLLNFVAPLYRKAYVRHLLACRREVGVCTVELRLTPRRGPPGGVPVLMRTWSNPARFDPGAAKAFEFRTALLDLTERERAREKEAVYQQRLRSLASELSLAEERERRRIAVEIHDSISQALAMAKLKLETAARANGPPIAGVIAEVSRMVGDVLAQSRTLTFELSPPVLYELGFEPALEWLAERTAEQHGLEVAVDLPDHGADLPHDVAVLMFQAARELLVNVAKHARARHAVLRLRLHDGRVDLAVQDDGRGFAKSGPQHDGTADSGTGAGARTSGGGNGQRGGFGLFSIRARLDSLGGTLRIDTPHGGGARVTMSVPLVAPGPAPALPGFAPGADGNSTHNDDATTAAPAPEAFRAAEIVLDELVPSRNDGTSVTLPPSLPEGPDHESTPRRRPPHRARRPQEPPGKPA